VCGCRWAWGAEGRARGAEDAGREHRRDGYVSSVKWLLGCSCVYYDLVEGAVACVGAGVDGMKRRKADEFGACVVQ